MLSLTLREESRLKVFENRILRRIFGPKRDDNAEWIRLYNEELVILYPAHNIFRAIKSRRLRWAGHVARMEEDTTCFKILTDKPTGKIPIGRRRWEDNYRINLKEIGVKTRNWVDSAQDRDS